MAEGHILIVDDDISIRKTLERTLRNHGYKVQTAATGKQALEMYRSVNPDLVILDMLLPDMHGLEIAQVILQQATYIPIILISGYAEISDAVKATKMGAYDFLTKPLDRNRLLITVRNALMKSLLEREVNQYREEMLQKYRMIGQSPAMQEIFDLIERIAPTSSPVLITGENGTGKELIANAIHAKSNRRHRPLIKINCPAIPSDILESELFGHTRGAFTGASDSKKGRLEMADGGTVFLDEIGEIDQRMQVKLLRFLENGEIQKVGSTETIQVDVRLIAATNRDLFQAVQKNTFREDLYYRINVLHIHIPPLRERKEDIPLLVEHFAREIARENGFTVPHFTPSAMRYLTHYPWPGNIRQLRNFVERLMIIHYQPTFDLEDVRPFLDQHREKPGVSGDSFQPLQQAREEFEREYILQVLRETNWNVSRAARILGINRTNFYRKIKKIGLRLDEGKMK